MVEEQAQSILALLSRPPANRFFILTDPELFVARIITPNIETLVKDVP